jgi:hypothetical protein
MPALVAGIHAFARDKEDVDGRDKPGHDNALPFASLAGCPGRHANKSARRSLPDPTRAVYFFAGAAIFGFGPHFAVDTPFAAASH